MMMSLKEKALRGLIWSAAEKWGAQGATLLSFVILARLLSPDDFGLVAMASVYVSFVGLFIDPGWGTALIQKESLDREHLDTSFWISVLVGSLLSFVGVGLSGVIATIFKEPRLSPIVAWLSVGFFVSSLSVIQQAILQRDMSFKGLAIRTLTAKVMGGITGVVLAFRGFGVWSLVAQSLVTSIVSVVVLWQVSSWRPGFRFSGKHFKDLFIFGLSVLGTRVINFFDLRADDFLIGYFLGATALGYYTVAYRVLLMLQEFIMGLSHQVIYSVFSRMKKDKERLRNAFYQASQFANFAAWPVFLGVAVIAPELVIGIVGEKWAPSVFIMQILALAGIPLCVHFLSGQLVVAFGKPNWHLVIRLIISFARITTYIIAVRWGIAAVAVAFVFINVAVFAPLNIWIAHRVVHLDFKTYFGFYVAPMTGSLLMVGTVLIIKQVMPDVLGLYWQLISFIALGASVYFLSSKYLQPDVLRQSLEFGRLLMRRKEKLGR